MSDMFATVDKMAGARPWERSGDTAMVRGSQSIARYGVKGTPDCKYQLYGAGPEALGHWPTPQEAMDAADILTKKAA